MRIQEIKNLTLGHLYYSKIGSRWNLVQTQDFYLSYSDEDNRGPPYKNALPKRSHFIIIKYNPPQKNIDIIVQ
jgi:hypothetical protein